MTSSGDKVLIITPLYGEPYLTILEPQHATYKEYADFARRGDIFADGNPISKFLNVQVAKQYGVPLEVEDDTVRVNSVRAGAGKRSKLRV